MFSPIKFPNMAAEGFTKTSEPTFKYNCIAWAVSDQKNWWWPLYDLLGNEGYWPKNVPRAMSLKAFTDAFKTKGFSICKTGDVEMGFEKIAIYTIGVKPTHAARQLPDGKWTHKAGPYIDVTSTLFAFEGPEYGTVVRFMRKKVEALTPVATPASPPASPRA